MTADTTLHGLFQAQTERTPDGTAVAHDRGSLTYAGLAERAGALARLLHNKGVGPSDVVAIALDRSPDLVAAMFAVLDVGAAYLPVDLAYPADRIAYMLDDAAPVCVLTDPATAGRLPASPQVFLDGARPGPPLPRRRVLPDEAAYIVYTSGSTGRPKGVVVSHRAIVNYLEWMRTEYPLGAGDRMVQKTPVGFDGAVLEFFLPLATGATIVLAPPGVHREPERVADLIARERITVAQFVPSMLPAILDEELAGRCATLRRVYSASDVLPPAVQRRFKERLGAELVNLYGPTEAAVDVAHWRCSPRPDAAYVPVGTPVTGMRIDVLDVRLRPAPPHEVGEVYLAGVQLARGYLNRPGLTAERFVADPLGPAGGRMYRTGDLGRKRDDGVLEIVGRVDDQAKIGGVRVEPAEVEAALAEHPSVAGAAVKAVTDPAGDARLVAYVVPIGGRTLTEDAVRRHLRARLPDAMVPTHIMFLDDLPLTPNEKLDRTALPAPTFAPATSDTPFLALVGEVLGQPQVSLTDSFIGLGGDSISAIRLASRARQAGFRISTGDVLRHRTLDDLSRAAVRGHVPASVAVDGVGPFPPTPIMSWLRELGGPVDGFAQSMVVHTPADAGEPELLSCLQAVIDRHDMLRARFPAGSMPEVLPVGTVTAASCLDIAEIPDVADGELPAAVRQCVDRARARLDSAAGHLLRAVWLRRGQGRQGRLVVLVHHLAVDGVSLRIIHDDLHDAWRTLRQTGTATLAPVPTPFRQWAAHLARDAVAGHRRDELDHWTAADTRLARPLARRPLDPRIDTLATARSYRLDLPAALTGPLLDRAPQSFGADINTVLLTGLALVLAEAGADPRVALEGHGREDIFPGLDTSRTVGWFTSLFPVRLDLDRDPDTRSAVAQVGARLAAVPGKGIGYGLLRYTNPGTADRLAHSDRPEILFNYLGRFPEADRRDWSFDADHDVAMDEADGSMPLAFPIEINALTMRRGDGHVFSAVWEWADGLFDGDQVRHLADRWFVILARIAGEADRPATRPAPVDLESEFRSF